MIERKPQIQLDSHQSFFLFGARGTGKTTLLHQLFARNRTLWIDLLDLEEQDLFSRSPQELERRVRARDEGIRWVVIDEIQKIPRILDGVHRLIENEGISFALTGSSSRKLKRGAANLLAGRAFVHTLHPFCIAELPGIDELAAMRFGMLPKVFEFATDSEREQFLRAYALTYIKEEIQEEQLIRRLPPFRAFLEVAAQANGKIVNFLKIAKTVGVAPATIASYFEILEETLVGFFLPAWHRSVRKRQLASPKFYFFDCGVKRALDRTLTVDLLPQTSAFGEAFEHFLILEIRKCAAYRFPDWQFFYLNTGSDAEIDLIIERPGQPLVFMEIKSSERIDEGDIRHLESISNGMEEALLLCASREKNRRRIGRVLCLHWKDAFAELDLS